ncbi:MAG: proline dehydrogenase family protein [Bacteroidales bacterium]|nr:proline dehydrogenase family protein [Bacteroidales bacterium]
MIDFKNTEKAFVSKSNRDMKKALVLYKVMASPFITRIAKILTQFALAIHFPVNWIVKPTIYNLFVGGETIDECNPTVKLIGNYGVKSILDYSVEGKESIEDIEKALAETLHSIENAGKFENIPFAVFKPTAFTSSHILTKASSDEELTEEEKIEAQNFKNRVKILCQKAYDVDVPILIDAEDSWYQNFIDETVDAMMLLFNKEKAIVFNTWQMYRKDRLENLKKTYEKAKEGGYFLGTKFVRGAYMEKERERAEEMGYESPIHETKEDTDKAYNDALRFSFEHRDIVSTFNGTHNEESTLLLVELMKENNIEKTDKRFWFSQLFGMSDNLSFNLGAAGYNVSKYLPYGPVKHVLPYLFRRAEENTSVKGQTSRELVLIHQEIKRRKQNKE